MSFFSTRDRAYVGNRMPIAKLYCKSCDEKNSMTNDKSLIGKIPLSFRTPIYKFLQHHSIPKWIPGVMGHVEPLRNVTIIRKNRAASSPITVERAHDNIRGFVGQEFCVGLDGCAEHYDADICTSKGRFAHIQVKIRRGREVEGLATRTLDFQTKCARNDLFIIDDGQDTPRKKYPQKFWVPLIAVNGVQVCRYFGIERIYLDAGLQDGPRAWAQRGWWPTNQMEWLRLRRHIRERWDSSDSDVWKSQMTAQEQNSVDNALNNNHRSSLTDLFGACSRFLNVPIDDNKTLKGWLTSYLLHDLRWKGVLDLNNFDQMRIWAGYHWDALGDFGDSRITLLNHPLWPILGWQHPGTLRI